jgi:hypothetical protein
MSSPMRMRRSDAEVTSIDLVICDFSIGVATVLTKLSATEFVVAMLLNNGQATQLQDRMAPGHKV